MSNNFVEVLGDSLDNIKTVENFLSEQEQQYLISVADKAERLYNGNRLHVESIRVIWGYSEEEAKIILENFKPIQKRILEVATKAYKTEFIDVDNFGMNVHKINSFTDPHTDVIENSPGAQIPGYKEKGIPNWRDAWDGYLACNVYVNDNYYGGEVYFPERNYEFKPKARSIVFWPGNKYFIHGIRKTMGASRYVYGSFIKFKDYEKYDK